MGATRAVRNRFKTDDFEYYYFLCTLLPISGSWEPSICHDMIATTEEVRKHLGKILHIRGFREPVIQRDSFHTVQLGQDLKN